MGAARIISSVGLITTSRLAGAAIGFGTQVILARIFSIEELGEFFFATSLASFLAIVAAGGFPSVTARFLIRYRDRGAGNFSALFMRTSRRVVLASAFIVAAAAIAAIQLWPDLAATTRTAATLGCLAVIPAAMCRVSGAAATAYRRFNLSFLPDLLVRPVVFLAAIVVLQAATGGAHLYAVLGLFAVLLAAQAAYQTVSVRRLVPAGPTAPVRPGRVTRIWWRSALPLLGIALFTAVFGDLAILLAGLFLGKADLAVFGVAVKITLLVGFALGTAYQVTLPDLAEALKRRDFGRLSRAIGVANLIGIGVSLAALLGALVAGDRILALFGPEFVGGRDYLLVLLLGQLIIAAGGPSVQLLTLTARQTGAMRASFVALGALFALNALLIPPFGLWGAVAAVLLTNLLWSGWLALLAQAATGVRSDAAALVAFLHRPRPAPAAE